MFSVLGIDAARSRIYGSRRQLAVGMSALKREGILMSVLRKGEWRLFVLLAAVCAAAVTLWMVVAATAGAASAAHGVQRKAKKHHARHYGKRRLTSGSYTNGAGSLDYELYVPSTYRAGSPMPVVVALHGCTESADSYRQLSGWAAMGESKGFIVLFPQQLSSRNYLTCWNWFVQPDMHRGSGEPAIIAGMVNRLKHLYSVDTNRVYVAGFSAGGAMANVMGATYPDMFAAVGSGSGCEYNGLPCLGIGGPSPSQTGQEAFQAMGRYARVMPAIVFQGDADYIVAPANGPQIAQEWRVTDNYVASGGPNGSIPTNPTNQSFGFTPGGTTYTKSHYGDGHGHELIEYWSIHGMGHAWSGGNSSQQYADPSGPGETAAMWAFFASHPR
jgi:poly(hydroxyalkanoate) depolymerase family esterase